MRDLLQVAELIARVLQRDFVTRHRDDMHERHPEPFRGPSAR